MIRNLAEQLRRRIEGAVDQISSLSRRHDYREYLRERLHQMYKARQDEADLLTLLADPGITLGIEHLDRAGNVATILAGFGLTAKLFDNDLYQEIFKDRPDLVAHPKHSDSLAATRQYLNSLFLQNDRPLTAPDIRHFAAVNYHLETFRWIAQGICPWTDSPYAQRQQKRPSS